MYHVFLTFTCVQMHEFNVFSYMDSAFMQTLEDRIAHVRILRAVDFAEEDKQGFSVEGDEPVRPELGSPLKLLVCDSRPFNFVTFVLTTT